MQYTIVDDNVEEVPTYRCEGKAPEPTRPHENHGLAIEHLPAWSESHQKLQLKSFGIGLFCCYFFWCQPTRLACRPLKSGKMQYTIVDDNVEEAPIYKCEGKAPEPTRPHKNHGLAKEHLPAWSESHQKLQLKSFARIIG